MDNRVGELIGKTELNFVVMKFNALPQAERNKISEQIAGKKGGGEILWHLFIDAEAKERAVFFSKFLGIEVTPDMATPVDRSPQAIQTVMKIAGWCLHFRSNLPVGNDPLVPMVSL